METVKFSSVVRRAAALAGMDLTQDLFTSDVVTLLEMLNRRTQEGWEAYLWPELCRTEERTLEAARPLIPWADTGKTPIGTPAAAWWDDPAVNPAAQRAQYVLSDEGVHVVDEQVAESVWLRFRLRAPDWTSEVYSASRT